MKRLTTLLLATLPVSFAGIATWFGLYTFVNGYLVRGLGYTNEQWTETTLWFIGSMIAWQLLCTDIAARAGRRNTVTISLVAGALFYIGMGMTSDGLVIRALMALAGFTQAVGLVTWQPLIAEYGRERPGRALVINQLVNAVVGALTLIAGGQIIANASYRDAFIALGVACAGSAVMFHLVSRDFESEQSEVVSLLRVMRTDWRKLATGGFMVLTVVGLCLEPFNYLTVNQLFPNLARDAHGLLDGDISTIVALGRLPALLTLFVLAAVVDRMNAMRAYGAGIALVGLCVVGLGLASGVPSLIGIFLVYFLIQGSVWGSNAAAVNASVAPPMRDSAFAVTSVLLSIALFGVGFVQNRLLGAGLTVAQVFLICGLVPVAAGTILVLYSLRRKPIPGVQPLHAIGSANPES
ncbi:MAG: MFS transporter [Chloroflexi bacterium]|nr:MFS transporter [Chloroflexota bacterium]MCL5273282.1 MFS transporter [Chloroflexota bacterium]